jgi:glycosyltransferase involved in cell wall biosynthesis
LAAERGHKVTVLTPRREETPRRERVDGVDIVRPFPAKPAGMPAYSAVARVFRFLFSFALLGYALWFLWEREFDVLHSASASTHWVAKLCSVVYDRPLVSFVGYTPSVRGAFEWTPAFVRERFNFRLCMGEVVFCRSKSVKRVIERSGNSDVRVLHGILHTERVEAAVDADVGAVRERYGLPEDARLLVFVGRFVPIKGPVRAVNVVADLPETYHLVMLGDGPEREAVESAVQRRGLRDRVSLPGTVPHDEALQTMWAAEGLLVTSEAESYSTVALEALALGSTVFGTAVGVLRDIEHSRLHVESLDELARAVERVAPERTGNIDEDVLRRFSMERYADDLLDACVETGGP